MSKNCGIIAKSVENENTKREKRVKEIFKVIMAENFLKLVIDTKLQIQNSQI
jgi:hypothetical protein